MANSCVYIYERLSKLYASRQTDLMDRGVQCEVEDLECPFTPESVIQDEQDEQVREKAMFHGRKLMTSMERKVFNRLCKGLSEPTIANQLHITQQRVNRLKAKAFAKVQKLYDEWR